MIFFFNDTATTEIYTLSLHDALPICPLRLVVAHRPAEQPLVEAGQALRVGRAQHRGGQTDGHGTGSGTGRRAADRESTRLNSSHAHISYAVFCVKKKQSCSILLRYCT